MLARTLHGAHSAAVWPFPVLAPEGPDWEGGGAVPRGPWSTWLPSKVRFLYKRKVADVGLDAAEPGRCLMSSLKPARAWLLSEVPSRLSWGSQLGTPV